MITICFPALDKCLKSIKEFGLDTVFTDKELDIIDKKDIDRTVFVTEFRVILVLDAGDKSICEGFACGVDDLLFGMLLDYGIAYGLHEVGLAKT